MLLPCRRPRADFSINDFGRDIPAFARARIGPSRSPSYSGFGPGALRARPENWIQRGNRDRHLRFAYALIASGRIPHVLVAFLGAIAMVIAGVVPEENALAHVDMEVILLLAAMMSLADVIGRTGVFDWAAIRAAQLVRGSGFGTMALLAATTAIGSAFLDNVTVIVLAVPITLSICRTLGVEPIPFLLAQVFASNIGGASTIVADPPNIIIAAAADIAFIDFMVNVRRPGQHLERKPRRGYGTGRQGGDPGQAAAA